MDELQKTPLSNSKTWTTLVKCKNHPVHHAVAARKTHSAPFLLTFSLKSWRLAEWNTSCHGPEALWPQWLTKKTQALHHTERELIGSNSLTFLAGRVIRLLSAGSLPTFFWDDDAMKSGKVMGKHTTFLAIVGLTLWAAELGIRNFLGFYRFVAARISVAILASWLASHALKTINWGRCDSGVGVDNTEDVFWDTNRWNQERFNNKGLKVKWLTSYFCEVQQGKVVKPQCHQGS